MRVVEFWFNIDDDDFWYEDEERDDPDGDDDEAGAASGAAELKGMHDGVVTFYGDET